MLHIHNGDSTANLLKESGLEGQHSVWREALIAGPTPHGLSLDQWLAVRARHLAEAYEQPLQRCEDDLRQQFTELASFVAHDEVVLWFEHDLFCQANLIFLLAWFARQDLNNTRLQLICINQFRGVTDFRGLGQLSPQQLASLFERRREVTAEPLALASQAWAAYTSPNPQALETLLTTDTSPLPFLQAALRLHLRRFPSVRNGLGETEGGALELIQSGCQDFRALFPAFSDRYPHYGLGDYQFWNALKRMIAVEQPLLRVSGFDDLTQALESGQFHRATFELTETGAAILAGRADYIALNGIDVWLGGVHLQSDAHWRWDEPRQRLIQ